MVYSRRRFMLRAGQAALAASLPRLSLAQLRRITIGANPAGTNFNVIAGGFAKALQETLRVQSTVRPYSGSSVYVPLLQRGEITLGINSGIDSFLAYRGEPPYGVQMTNLRGLMAVYPLGYMFWVRADSSIRSLEDLRGRRVVLNYRGLVPLDRLNRAVLATAGLGEDDVVAVTAAGLPEGARLVAEGRADAVAMGYRLPIVKQAHASLPGGLRFLRLGDDESRIAAIMPGAWAATVVPDATSVGIEGPTRFANYDTYLNGGVHISDDDAYSIVKVLHEAWPQLQRDYPLLRDVRSEDLASASNPHPYHPGAIAYFREAGLWTDAHEEQNRSL